MKNYSQNLKKLSVLTLFAISVFTLISQLLLSQKTINVDLNVHSKTQTSIVGFLHFNNLKSLDNDLVELKPKYWRIGNTMIQENLRKEQIHILHQHGIIPVLVLTDFYSHRNPEWKKPYLDKSGFLKLIEELYRENGNNVIYDIWNEPNHELFFDGTRENFFEIFKLAHDKIRSLPGGKSAKIMGPSTAGFYREYIEDFLKYCSKNNITLDYIDWHQNGGIKDAVEMKDNILMAKSNYLKNYASLKIKDIFVSEIIGPDDYFNPLTSLVYIYYLDYLNVGGCKTCGPTDKEKGGDICWNNSIDGLITHDGKPRSVWWVYKYYAESLSARFSTSTDSDKTVAISYFSKDSNSVNILFGNIGKLNSTFSVNLKSVRKFPLFAKSTKFNYTLYKIPNTEQIELLNPILVKKGNVSISSKNTSALALDDIDTQSVYLLKMNN